MPARPTLKQCRGLVNLHQTPEERKDKYWLARSAGHNSSWSRTMRDWSIHQLERKLNLTPVEVRTDD